MKIAVDFDGTIVTHMFPLIGAPVPNAKTVLHRLTDAGHELFLWTMRSGQYLVEAVEYCSDNGIILSGINLNQEQKSWTESPKLYANYYIDDSALGCPILFDPSSKRNMVNWREVEAMLTRLQILTPR